MRLKYELMWFDLPEYYGGNCDKVNDFDSPEKAFKEMEMLETKNKNENLFYKVVVVKDS